MDITNTAHEFEKKLTKHPTTSAELVKLFVNFYNHANNMKDRELKQVYFCNKKGCSCKGVFISHGCTSTLLGWQQAFDKYGRPLNADPNTVTELYSCNGGRTYTKITNGWISRYYEGRHQTGMTEEFFKEVDNTPDYLRSQDTKQN